MSRINTIALAKLQRGIRYGQSHALADTGLPLNRKQRRMLAAKRREQNGDLIKLGI